MWLYGVVLIPVVMLVLPKRWFVTPPRKETRDGAFAADTQPNEGKTSDNAQPVIIGSRFHGNEVRFRGTPRIRNGVE